MGLAIATAATLVLTDAAGAITKKPVGVAPLKPSTTFNEAKIRAKKPAFRASGTYRTASGNAVTGQQYIDTLNKLHAIAEQGDCLSTSPCHFAAADAKLTAAQLKGVTKLAATTIKPKADRTKSATSPLGFSWNGEWGNRNTGGVYVGADFGNGGGAHSASCGGKAWAGAYLFGHQKEVLRLESQVSSTSSAVSKSAVLYVLGDQVWSKESTTSSTPLTFEKSFSVTESLTYWAIITLNATAKVTATASITGSVSGEAKTNEMNCAITLTPGVKASVGGSVEVAVLGYGGVAAGAAGVEVNLTLASLSMPIKASVSSKKDGNATAFSESLSASLSANFLSGSFDAYFTTWLPLDGESWTDWDDTKLTFTIFDWAGTTYGKPLYEKSATQTL